MSRCLASEGTGKEAPATYFASLTRISDLTSRPFETKTLPRNQWENGDYVVGSVLEINRSEARIELCSGRLVTPLMGDLVVGALGVRHATLEAVGSYEDTGPDGVMTAMTGAGLFGKTTSESCGMPWLIRVVYAGHVLREGRKVCMEHFIPEVKARPYCAPTALIVGTSMSSGKTTSASIIIRRLKRRGLRIVGAKLTGAGRYRDALLMGDAGADAVFDFVDVGLPSSVCPVATFGPRLRRLLALISTAQPQVVIAEAGASPLEPYNGDVVAAELRHQIKMTVLCASDPYAVVGVMRAFSARPDLVAGLATSTSAAVELVEKLAGTKALNLMDPASYPELDHLLDLTLLAGLG